MSAEEYRTILGQLGWTHAQAAAALGVSERTSFNYARRGAPKAVALAMKAALHDPAAHAGTGGEGTGDRR